jgi:hypothetical protein
MLTTRLTANDPSYSRTSVRVLEVRVRQLLSNMYVLEYSANARRTKNGRAFTCTWSVQPWPNRV